MAGFENNVMVSKNLNFDTQAANPHLGVINAAGKIPIGTGNLFPIAEILGGSLVSPNSSITIGYSSPNITLVTGSAVATIYQANTGSAVPAANTLNILGSIVAAGTNPLTTIGAGSTITIRTQYSQAIAATDGTKVGLSAFDSAVFTVDATGFVSATTTGFLKTLTGNSGGAIAPVANNINTVGTGSITIAGAGSTLTTQLTGLTNHAVLVGAGTATITNVGPTATVGQVLQSAGAAADPAFSTATYPLTTTVNQILFSSATNTVTGLATANNGVLTTGTTGIPVITALAANGQLIIGSGAGAPIAATLTAGTGISVTNAANSITIAVTATGVVQTLTGNSGGAISPTAGNINTLGTGSITIAGAGSTLTTQLTGLTNHAVLVGAGTATITNVGPTATAGQVLQSAGAAADPAFSTATYPLTTTVSQILYSSSTNTVTGLATANRAVLTTGATGIPVLTALAVDGQLIIGSTAGAPAAATLTAGTGISITNASNAITIAVTGSGFSWTDVTTATQALAVESGYLTDRGAGVVYTLPASASIGDEIIIVGKLGITTITPNANQQLLFSSASGTVGVTGTAVGTNVGDCVTLICTTSGASTVWRAVSFVGNWTIT